MSERHHHVTGCARCPFYSGDWGSCGHPDAPREPSSRHAELASYASGFGDPADWGEPDDGLGYRPLPLAPPWCPLAERPLLIKLVRAVARIPGDHFPSDDDGNFPF